MPTNIRQVQPVLLAVDHPGCHAYQDALKQPHSDDLTEAVSAKSIASGRASHPTRQNKSQLKLRRTWDIVKTTSFSTAFTHDVGSVDGHRRS
jgi:hypothetical protein